MEKDKRIAEISLSSRVSTLDGKKGFEVAETKSKKKRFFLSCTLPFFWVWESTIALSSYATAVRIAPRVVLTRSKSCPLGLCLLSKP